METPYRFSCTRECQLSRIVIDRSAARSWAERHVDETDHEVRVEAVTGQESFLVSDTAEQTSSL